MGWERPLYFNPYHSKDDPPEELPRVKHLCSMLILVALGLGEKSTMKVARKGKPDVFYFSQSENPYELKN